MSNAVLIETVTPLSSGGRSLKGAVTIVLAIWFCVVAVLGISGRFLTPNGTPPWPIGLGVMAPMVLFVLVFWRSPAFRQFILAIDPRFLVAMQAWRFAGLGFLALYANDVLPGVFALPAGLGDLAIGVTAPWILVSLIRNPAFLSSRWFVLWNVLGLLDLVDAVGLGISSQLMLHVGEQITTRPMAQLPLVFIPTFLVPIFAMLHVVSLMQSRRQSMGTAAQLAP